MSVTIDITIDHTKVPSTVTDFPVYVDLSDMPAAFWSTVTNGGGDIRVYRSDGVTECARDVVSCDTATDTGELHFLANSISASVDTVFKIVVDGTSSDYAVTDTYGRNAVWSDYEFVSHDGGGTDSAGNYTPSANGSPTIGGATGKIGDATALNGTNQYFNLGNMGSWASNYSIACTWQAWTKTSSTADKYVAGTFDSGDTLGMNIFRNPPTIENVGYVRDESNNNTSYFADAGTRATVADGNWHKQTMVFGNIEANCNYFLDGVESFDEATTAGESLSPTADIQHTMTIGARNLRGTVGGFWSGELDEVRVRNDRTTIDANWESTEYNNQNSPNTFYTATVAGGGGVIAPQFLGFAGL